jgi:hypothetical protein
MKLIKPLLIGLTAMVVAAGFAVSAQATLVTGQLNIAGTATYDHPIATATMVSAFDNVTTQGMNTGSFAAIAKGLPVAMTAPYVFNPSTPSPMLWSVAGFTFDLLTSTVVSQSKFGILIEGHGIISGNGFDPTPFTWSYSQQAGAGKTLSFSATTFNSPDGGMTVTLLGVGLVGLAVIRAKFAKV